MGYYNYESSNRLEIKDEESHREILIIHKLRLLSHRGA